MIYLLDDILPKKNYDFLIVGSGPCGLAFAEHMAQYNKNARICIVESGGVELDDKYQNLHEGGFLNNLIKEDFKNNRTRKFGGTSAMWGGESSVLLEDDFEEKPYFSTSGWPIKFSDVEPFYNQAAEYLNLKSYLDAPRNEYNLLPLDESLIVQKEWHYSTPVQRLGDTRFDVIQNSRQIDLLLECTVVGLDASSSKITKAMINRDGKILYIQAKNIIVATGGIENARCLLNWKGDNSKLTYSVKNVGRYFCVHPYFSWNPEQLMLIFGKNFNSALYEISETKRKKIHFTLPKELRDENRWENIAIMLWNRDAFNAGIVEELPDQILKTYDPMVSYSFNVMCDMRLMKDSRISLSQHRDRTGLLGVNVEMQLHPQTPNSWLNGMHHFAQTLADLGLGRIKFGKKDRLNLESLYQKGTWGAHHHLCATRMSMDSRNGVCDGYGKVFGTDNLYILGASTFSTASVVNPTFSAVALAIRLARNLT